MRRSSIAPLLILALAAPCTAAADDALEPEQLGAHYQSTYVFEYKEPFSARYSGPNSLSTRHEQSYSFTATAFLGARLWQGGELYFDPEVSAGSPLSGLTGLAGFTNGEMQKGAGEPKLYNARLFLRQTFGFGGGSEAVESGQNQLAGRADKRRLVITAGRLAVNDLFDTNRYAHDPRTQFLNWALMADAAYDFAADGRGYSWGAALEGGYDYWALRAGRFMLPREPNGLALDQELFRHYGDQIELEHAHTLGGREGRVRLLAYHDRARMARFADAMAVQPVPGITLVRNADRDKYGFGLNVEQALADGIGAFARGFWSDGRTETYAFTEADSSWSAGLSFEGSRWGRAHDGAGIALAQNALSRERRDYLAAGGIGYFIGDGALRYAPESIVEGYYRVGLGEAVSLSFDLQAIKNPAYNADRGPVRVASVRLHAEM